MMDGMIKSLFAVMGIKPEEGQRYIVETVKTIQSVDDRLSRIEAALARVENGLFVVGGGPSKSGGLVHPEMLNNGADHAT